MKNCHSAFRIPQYRQRSPHHSSLITHSCSSDHPSRHRASVFALLQHHPTVDDHLLYALGSLDQSRLVRRQVVHGL